MAFLLRSKLSMCARRVFIESRAKLNAIPLSVGWREMIKNDNRTDSVLRRKGGQT